MFVDELFNCFRPLHEGPKLTQEAFGKLTRMCYQETPRSRNLHILLPPWSGKIRYTHVLSEKILRNGGSFLTYEFPEGILSADCPATRAYFDMVKERVSLDIANIRRGHDFSSVSISGISLGCFTLCRLVEEVSGLKEVEMVVPGNCLAEFVWYGIRTQNFRREFERAGVSLDELKREWAELAPENHLDSLKKVPSVRVHISRTDKIIPYRLGRTLVDKMRGHGINPEVTENRFLGHYGTALGFYYFSNPPE